MMIVNLTQHKATSDQIADDVWDLPIVLRDRVQHLLTFDKIPTKHDLFVRAEKIVEVAETFLDDQEEDVERQAMIGGAPFLMPYLERALRCSGITPVYAFSRRESVEFNEPDGTVTKKQAFKHLGFVVAD